MANMDTAADALTEYFIAPSQLHAKSKRQLSARMFTIKVTLKMSLFSGQIHNSGANQLLQNVDISNAVNARITLYTMIDAKCFGFFDQCEKKAVNLNVHFSVFSVFVRLEKEDTEIF